MKANLELLADMLHGSIKYPFLGLPFYVLVKGLYKGRPVICCYNTLFRKTGQFSICIEPLGIPRKSELTSFPCQGPTEYTSTSGNRIYYSGPSGFFIGRERCGFPHLPGTLFKPLDKRDMAAYLDHLISAAEISEKTASAHLTFK
jgi:hypothetical protein